MILKTALANRNNYGNSRPASAIKYLIYHYTANDGDSDESNAKYFQNNVVQASAHRFVDDDSCTISVPDLMVAWSVGGGKWGDCSVTGGGKMYGKITNYNSISIEMCDAKRDGKVMVTEATMRNAIAVGKELMALYGIPYSNVYRHFDVNGKHCPAYFMDDAAWNKFKSRLLVDLDEPFEEDEDMDVSKLTDAQVLQLADRMQTLLGKKELEPKSTLYKELEEAKKLGITDGERPYQFCNRVQAAVMAKRAITKK